MMRQQSHGISGSFTFDIRHTVSVCGTATLLCIAAVASIDNVIIGRERRVAIVSRFLTAHTVNVPGFDILENHASCSEASNVYTSWVSR